MKYNPSSYQTYAADFILTHPACLLALQMGMGKTVITLTALSELLLTGEVERVLVIAPLNVARTVWAEEIAKWDHLHGIRAVKVLGSAAEREEALATDADLYIINRENTKWLVDRQIKQKTWPFDAVVIDELSSFKSRESQRWKAMAKARPQVKRIVGLTGTPTPNSLLELWPQMYLLDQGARLGKHVTRFRDMYFRPDQYNAYTGQVYSYKLLPGADKLLYDKVRDVMISMSAEDYVQLPDKLLRTVQVPLPASARKQYEQLQRDLVLSLPDGEVTAANAAVLCNKLLQMSSGELYTADKGSVRVHDAKLQALQEIVSVATSPVLVFYAFRHEAARLKEALPEARQLHNAQDVSDWNQGKIPVLLAHPDSAGHGLNLQSGGHTIVWYSLTWSLEKYQQACARLWRRGQKEPVIIHHLVATGTMDERVMRVLEGKDDGQKALLQAVRALVEEVV
jgi:SNF2 family DNA or RNA helicase